MVLPQLFGQACRAVAEGPLPQHPDDTDVTRIPLWTGIIVLNYLVMLDKEFSIVKML